MRVVKYIAKDGMEVTLDFETIRKFLVQGRAEFVTAQEMFFFMNTCRSRGLNPSIKDCYLIKYTQNDPAAIVTSRDYFRKRAKAQKDCTGWHYGIIVERDGKLVKSFGLMLEGDKLLGGWFKAKPTGWTEPFELEVNLSGYIKRTRDGNLTRFWSPENQPSQIAKVAESQGLRACWPDEFQSLYSPEEVEGAEMLPPIPNEIEALPDLGQAIKDMPEAPKSPPESTISSEPKATPGPKKKKRTKHTNGDVSPPDFTPEEAEIDRRIKNNEPVLDSAEEKPAEAPDYAIGYFMDRIREFEEILGEYDVRRIVQEISGTDAIEMTPKAHRHAVLVRLNSLVDMKNA